MINSIGDYTIRQYNILLACVLKTMGLGGDLATAAAIIYQIDYWIDIFKNNESNKPTNQRKHYKNGKWWVYNTMAEWQLQFPYVAEKTMKRTLAKLKKSGLVETGRFNQKGYDRTTWYTLNYKTIESLMQQERDKLSLSNDTKLSLSKGTNCPYPLGQIVPNNTKEYTKNNPNSTHKPESRKKGYRKKSSFNSGLENEYSKADFQELEALLLDN